MGDLVRRVAISFVDEDGNMGKPYYCKALLDSGASITVVPHRIIKKIGASLETGCPTYIDEEDCDTAVVAVRLVARRCSERVMAVAVSDRVAKKASPKAHIILGHDYLQLEQAVLSYSKPKHKVSCLSSDKFVRRKG